MLPVPSAVAQIVGGLGEPDEVGRDQPGALMDQLVEGVLAVGSRLAPEDFAGVVRHWRAVSAHGLAVGLHRQLLQIGGETGQVVRIGQYRTGFRAEELVVPEPDQAEQHRRVGLQRRGAEMLVDDVESGEELGEPLAADDRHHAQSDRAVH